LFGRGCRASGFDPVGSRGRYADSCTRPCALRCRWWQSVGCGCRSTRDVADGLVGCPHFTSIYNVSMLQPTTAPPPQARSVIPLKREPPIERYIARRQLPTVHDPRSYCRLRACLSSPRNSDQRPALHSQLTVMLPWGGLEALLLTCALYSSEYFMVRDWLGAVRRGRRGLESRRDGGCCRILLGLPRYRYRR